MKSRGPIENGSRSFDSQRIFVAFVFQNIYKDEYGIDDGIDSWASTSSRCFVHFLNSIRLFEVTGAEPLTMPPTASDYSKAGLPWFDHYDGDKAALDGAMKLAGMQSVASKSWQTGAGPLPGNEPATPRVVKMLGMRRLLRKFHRRQRQAS